MKPIRKGQVLRNVRFGHCVLYCNMIICGPMKLKKYKVDLPTRIFKKFARGETEFPNSYFLKKFIGETFNFTNFLTKPRAVY